MSSYTEAEARAATLDYFNGDALAMDTVVTKYLLRNENGDFIEKTPDDIHRRMAREFARIEAKFGGPRALSFEQIYETFKKFKQILPQGSPMYGIGNKFKVVSLSNCVVVESPQDDMSSIMDTAKDVANLLKRRCGVGVDLSKLRPEGSNVQNSAGTSTGAWSFADLFSYVCRKVAQKGRRGALMLTMDVRHPDIDKFVTMKLDKTQVTGANVSVKLTDDFMLAVENDTEFTLRWPVNSPTPKVTRVIRARDLWELIVKTATESAEPGLMMWDNILKMLPAHCYADVGFETIGTNPCGELPLSANDSCRLIALLLSNFVRGSYSSEASFDFDAFGECVRTAMRLSDDLVELEIEKLQAILDKVDTESEKVLWEKMLHTCSDGRRTGLGTLGLADTLAALRLPYGSDEAVAMTEAIFRCLKEEAYGESACLAIERGAFPVFEWGKEKNNIFIQGLPPALQEKMSKTGRRNISILTNAPTGSMAILAQSSSGIEPVFRNVYIRKKKVNHDTLSDARIDEIDALGDAWQHFPVFHHAVKAYLDERDLTKDEIPEFFRDSTQIPWKERIDMQAAAQRHIDHSISSTINLPAGTPVQTVADLYFYAWKQGLKGVTVYVDGSRSGVLVTQDDKSKKTAQIGNHTAPKRPRELPCEIHRVEVRRVPHSDETDHGPEGWILLVGLLDGKPYEVFGGAAEVVDIPDRYTTGTLVKRSGKKNLNAGYDLRFGEGVTVKNIVKVFDNPLYGSLTRFISMSLRHGVPVQFIVEQLQKDDSSPDLFGFARVMARTLKKHIPDGKAINADKLCPSCSSPGLVYQEGCATCLSCGYSKCG